MANKTIQTLILSIGFLGFASCMTFDRAFADDHNSAEAFFVHYLDAYDAYDVPTVLSHYSDQVLISGLPSGAVVMNKGQLENLFSNFLGQQKAAGVVDFEWQSLSVHEFSDKLALSSNVAARYDAKGVLVGTAAASMQAYKAKSGWQIVSLTLHSESSALPISETTLEKNFTQALAREDRSTADKARDANRQPRQVMQFAGIKPGMTVLDLVAAGGYYTEVLSHRVGPTGKVYAHNTEFVLNARNGAFQKEITARLANNRLPNVERLDREFGNLGLSEQADAMTMVLNYHDFYNQPRSKRLKDLADMRRALKPNGIFIVVDSNAAQTDHDPKLHRINRDTTINEIQSVGFELSREAFFLRNPNDPLTNTAFDKSIRGNTDRFVLIFEKSGKQN